MPRIVRQFIEKLDINVGTYCFAVINYRGLKLDTLGLLDDVLHGNGVRLSYGKGISMPGNSITNYGPISPEKVRKKIENANIEISEVVEAISNKKVRSIRRFGTRISNWGNNSIYKNIKKFDEKFTVTENCNGCGICRDICPVRNIKLESQKPTWQHHCERCLACIQWCPKEAIQYGQKTVKRRRYHNPDVTVKDIVEGNNSTKNC
jgi:ferredoxin